MADSRGTVNRDTSTRVAVVPVCACCLFMEVGVLAAYTGHVVTDFPSAVRANEYVLAGVVAAEFALFALDSMAAASTAA